MSQYDNHDVFRDAIYKQLESINERLERMDEAIRGNGHPGIKTRLERLEDGAKTQAKIIWVIFGTAATSVASGITAWLTGRGGRL